jgi:hypothetical protein
MEHVGENSVDTLERRWEVLAKFGNRRQVADDSTTHQEFGNTERQNS